MPDMLDALAHEVEHSICVSDKAPKDKMERPHTD
jgi:hypothetical protein